MHTSYTCILLRQLFNAYLSTYLSLYLSDKNETSTLNSKQGCAQRFKSTVSKNNIKDYNHYHDLSKFSKRHFQLSEFILSKSSPLFSDQTKFERIPKQLISFVPNCSDSRDPIYRVFYPWKFRTVTEIINSFILLHYQEQPVLSVHSPYLVQR